MTADKKVKVKKPKVKKTPIQSVQVFGRKKTATAVAYCKSGTGNIRVNGRPLDMVEPRVLQYKIQEPILLLGKDRFNEVDMRVRVNGGGHVAQIYAIRQAISKALVSYYQKYVDEASKKEIKDILIQYDRTLLVADPRRCEPKKFGGQERDVIIMSCVRASGHGVGFVADIRRMNVALTRARRALWVMGNANSLVQSEDWAALIADAKTRKCYMDMDTLPKDFLLPKAASHAPPQTNMSNNRGLRSGLRHRIYDPHMEPRSGTPSEDDEKPNALYVRNGSYRPPKPSLDNSLNDFDQPADRSRDAWQNGIQRRQNTAGIGRRDL